MVTASAASVTRFVTTAALITLAYTETSHVLGEVVSLTLRCRQDSVDLAIVSSPDKTPDSPKTLLADKIPLLGVRV